MAAALISLGFFLLFALGFNGSVGTDLVDKAFFSSSILMIISGAGIIAKANWNIVRALCGISVIAYLPMVWQRFNFSFGVNWGGVAFDVCIVIFIITIIAKKPNNTLKWDRANRAAP